MKSENLKTQYTWVKIPFGSASLSLYARMIYEKHLRTQVHPVKNTKKIYTSLFRK